MTLDETAEGDRPRRSRAHPRACARRDAETGLGQPLSAAGDAPLGSGTVVAIEWADRLPLPPEGAIVVRIEHAGDLKRVVTVEPWTS